VEKAALRKEKAEAEGALLAVNERVKEFREDKAYLRKLLNEAREELKEASKTRPSDNIV